MEILENFRAWLTFSPLLTNEDIRKYDFSKLDLEEEKRKYIESIEKYEPKRDNEETKKELEKIKTWEDLKMEILIKKLQYAKNAVASCLENENVSVDFHGLSYWANEVERLRKEIKENL